MKNLIPYLVSLVLAGFGLSALTKTVIAQDAVAADPKHYKVAYENSQIRVLRAKYGKFDKSVMHEHPDYVVVFLTDVHARFTFPDGRTMDRHGKAGDVLFIPKEKHIVENPESKAFEAILVEIKPPAAPSKAKPAKGAKSK